MTDEFPKHDGQDFFDELRLRPECELIGGPLDGAVYQWPSEKRRASFRNQETGVINIYLRERDGNRFFHAGGCKQ